MTTLSEVECAAGISRRALASLRVNGKADHNRGHRTPEKPTFVGIGVKDGTPGQPPDKTTVVETWCHDLAIININGWSFSLRDTQHISDRCQVTTIYFNRVELEALHAKIGQVLSETPARREE